MRLMIADLMWRSRWRTALFTVTLAFTFGPLIVIGKPARAFCASMCVAFAVGPMLTLWHVPRSLWFLPVARRDIWRSGWLVAVAGVTLLTTLVKLALLLVPQVREVIGLGGVVLSGVYDLAYLGVGCGLVIMATRPQPAGGWRRTLAGGLKGLADVLLPLGMGALYYLTMAVDNLLPTSWGDLGPRGIAVLLAGLGLTAATWFHSPTPVSPSNRLAPRRPKTAAVRLERGGLSGWPRLLLHESAWTLMTGGLIAVASVVFVVLAAKIAQTPQGIAGFVRTVFVQIEGRGTAPLGIGADAFVFLIGFAVFVASVNARFPLMIRHMRVLPLGTARLNALMVLWPAAVWLAAWTCWIALHYAVIGAGVVSYHAGVLLALIGTSAIVQSVTVRLSSVARIFTFACLVGVVPLMPLMTLVWTPKPAAFAASGASLVVAAALLNRRALSRSSTYRMVGPVIGMPRTPR